MISARVSPMPDDVLAAWREDRAAAGTPLPDPEPGDGYEALAVVLDDIEVGGTVLTYTDDAGHLRCSVRLLQTTIPDDAEQAWAAVVSALEAHVRPRGARSLVTAVPPRLAASFQAAGFGATMTGVAIRHPEHERVLADDGRVAVRAMTDDERRTFAAEASGLMRDGMVSSGVLSGPEAPMDRLDDRIVRLADDPSPDEVLLSAVVDDVQAGRFWATLVRGDDGLDLLGNYIDLFPEFRGQGLTRSFMAAVEGWVVANGVRDIRGLLYGQAHDARETVLGMGGNLDEIHLRKDIAAG